MHLSEIVTEEAEDVENETATQRRSGTVAITEVTGRQFHRVAGHLLDGNECPDGRQGQTPFQENFDQKGLEELQVLQVTVETKSDDECVVAGEEGGSCALLQVGGHGISWWWSNHHGERVIL